MGKGLDPEELSGGAEGWRGAEDELRELVNHPLKQGLLTLLTTLSRASPSSLSTHGTAFAHTQQLRAISLGVFRSLYLPPHLSLSGLSNVGNMPVPLTVPALSVLGTEVK